MNMRRRIWSIIWRTTTWGIAGGAGLGALYGPLSILMLDMLYVAGVGPGVKIATSLAWLPGWLILGSVAGLIYGGMTGLLIGLVNGLVLASLVKIVLTPPTNVNRQFIGIMIA